MTRRYAALLALPFLLLTGCAQSSGPQSVEVTWTDEFDDAPTTTSVDIGEVECTETSADTSIEAVTLDGYPNEPIFTAWVLGAVTTVTVQFDESYTFQSTEDISITDGSVTFRDLPGIVKLGETKIADDKATISSTVRC